MVRHLTGGYGFAAVSGKKWLPLLTIGLPTRATLPADSTFGSGAIRRSLPRFEPEARQANLALVTLLKQLADHQQALPQENVNATQVVLPPDDRRRLEQVLS